MSDAICKSKYLSDIFQHIEENISANLKTELISSAGYVSRDKLYYDFYSLTGHSVKEYIRKRRLSNALALIKASDMSFEDVALRCGYTAYLTMWREIKQMLDLTPSEYKESDTYFIFPPFNGELLHSVTISNKIFPKTICLLFYHSQLQGIEDTAINALFKLLPNYDGRIFGRNGKQVSNGFCYELYLTNVNQNYSILLAHGFEISRNQPYFASTFAMTTVQNEQSKINSAWNYLYSEWLQRSMFEYTGKPYFEEYIVKNSHVTKLKLYLPIKKRSSNIKISLVSNPNLRFIVAKANGSNADEVASHKVMKHLTTHYSHIAKTSRELYHQKLANAEICGVRINHEILVENDKNIGDILTTHDQYLVLESNVVGEYDRYADMLLTFALEHGMKSDKTGIFAVYDARESFQNVRLKMYCPVKFSYKMK